MTKESFFAQLYVRRADSRMVIRLSNRQDIADISRSDVASIYFSLAQGQTIQETIAHCFDGLTVTGAGSFPVMVFVADKALQGSIRELPWPLELKVGSRQRATEFYLEYIQ
jgi:hypothetical protein